MRTFIGPSGRNCVLISTLWPSKVGLFVGNLFWVGQYKTPNFQIGRTNTILIQLNVIPKQLL